MRMFQTKQKSNQNGIYRGIVKRYGNYNRRNYQNYRSIIRESYLGNFVVARCLEEIQKSARHIHFKAYKREKDKKAVQIENHPLELLLEQPNGMYYGSELKNRALLFYILIGEAPFQYIQNTFSSKLYVYRPDRISYKATGDENEPYKDIWYETAGRLDIQPEEFFMWKNYNPLDELDGLGHGISGRRSIFSKVDQYNALTKWNLSLLENGGNLSGIVSLEDEVDDPSFDRAKKELAHEHAGPENVGKYLLLDGGAKFFQTANTPKDMDYNELDKNIIKTIHSNMQVDPILTGFNEFSTYNNKKEAATELYTKTTIPILADLSDCLNMYFSKVGVLKDDEYVGLDTSQVAELQKNKKEITDRLSKNVGMEENEKRAELGLEPKTELEGLLVGDGYIKKGKEVFIPMNMVPVGSESNTNGQKSLFGSEAEGTWY